jgi:membrane-bound metal-dependent hydrolase YbcI (DUF457 family)
VVVRQILRTVIDALRERNAGRRSRAPDEPRRRPASTPERDGMHLVAEVVAEAPLIDSAAILVALERRLPAIEERVEAATFRRLGADYRAHRLDVRNGSIELIVSIFGTAALAVEHYGDLRDGLDRLAEDLATILGIEIGRAGAPGAQVDGFWRPPPGWTSAPPAAAPVAQAPDTADRPVLVWLLGAGAFLTTVLALIGASDADLDRLRVNHPVTFNVAIGVLIGMMLLAVAWPLLRARFPRWVKGGLVTAVVLVGVATYLVASLATNDLSAKTRPRIDVHLERQEGRTHVVGSVVATGLRTDEHIIVRIAGVGPLASRKAAARVPIYNARVGPDVNGNVDAKLNSAVPTGVYERLDVEADVQRKSRGATAEPRCDQATRTFGCVTISTPGESRRPSLSASWKGPRTIGIDARMSGLSKDDRVVLSVRRWTGKAFGRRLYAATWAPDPLGQVEQGLEVAALPKGDPICVIMRAVRGESGGTSERRLRRGPCTPRSRGTSVFLGRNEGS